MAKKTSQLKPIIHRYCDELIHMGIRPERVLLYGSQASGNAREGSDIDLIIISSDFAPYNERQRYEILGIAAAHILEPIQAKGITPQEISLQQLIPFWQQVIEEQAIAV
jgi:predicted nucleotidyltransferase